MPSSNVDAYAVELRRAMDLLVEAGSHIAAPDATSQAIDAFIEEMERPVVKVMRDDSPSNPFTEFDCELPILVAYLDRARYSMHAYGIEDALPQLPDDVVAKHWRDILAEIDIPDYPATVAGLREVYRHEVKWPCRGALCDVLTSLFCDYYREQDATDRLELLAKVYRWLGATAHVGSSTGYSQGDYAIVLAVATPEWVEKVGAPAESLQQQCEATVKLYGYWAWGDVWGFEISDRAGRLIDSCWGFYGDELDETGMLEHADAKLVRAFREAWDERFDR